MIHAPTGLWWQGLHIPLWCQHHIVISDWASLNKLASFAVYEFCVWMYHIQYSLCCCIMLWLTIWFGVIVFKYHTILNRCGTRNQRRHGRIFSSCGSCFVHRRFQNTSPTTTRTSSVRVCNQWQQLWRYCFCLCSNLQWVMLRPYTSTVVLNPKTCSPFEKVSCEQQM